jgi:hypothetical protein
VRELIISARGAEAFVDTYSPVSSSVILQVSGQVLYDEKQYMASLLGRTEMI